MRAIRGKTAMDTLPILRCAFLIILFSPFAVADPFRLENEIIYYDTVNSEKTDSIEFGHAELILEMLKDNQNIKILVLNVDGGMIEEAMDIADIVIDAELDTHVEHACESACVTIFLAGTKRSLALGGKIGFHKSYWDADSIKEYYDSEKDYYDWANPFDMASWLYEDTQAEVFSDFEYLLERGIEPHFAIQTLRAESDGMWYPRRKQLKAAGVLVE